MLHECTWNVGDNTRTEMSASHCRLLPPRYVRGQPEIAQCAYVLENAAAASSMPLGT